VTLPVFYAREERFSAHKKGEATKTGLRRL